MRLLAISGSLRRASTNTAALEALARLAPEGVKVLVYRDLAKLPPFNPDDDLEDRPKPEPVETLRALVGASDRRCARSSARATQSSSARPNTRMACRAW
jgi:chromate reductase